MKKLRCFSLVLLIILFFSGCHAPQPVGIKNLIVNVKDGYSDFSSTWGLSISLDGSQIDTDNYAIQWIVSDGFLRMWDEASLSAVNISNELGGYPCTYSDDENGGSVIWSPGQPNDYTEIGLEVNIYSKDDTTKPIALDSAKIIKKDSLYSVES